jgi:hypothetical protein
MRVEQNGSESCEVASNGGFVLVRIPVRVVGEVENVRAIFRYRIGGFVGRETLWSPRRSHETTLAYRIPRELFRERERLTLEVLRADDPTGLEILWAGRYEVRWANGAPGVEPVPDPGAPPAQAGHGL